MSGSIGLLRKAAVSLGLALLISACSGDPNRAAMEKAKTWLAEDKREITVQIEGNQPSQSMRLRESHAGRGFGEGVVKGAGVGALSALYVGAHGGPLGFAVGVIVAPFAALGGAVIGGGVGAATEDPTIHRRPLEEMEGGETISKAVQTDAFFAELLRKEIERQSKNNARHVFRMAPTPEDIDPKDTFLIVKIRTFTFAGNFESDPDLELQLAGITHFRAA